MSREPRQKRKYCCSPWLTVASHANIRRVWSSFFHLEPAVVFMPPLFYKAKQNKTIELETAKLI